MLDWLTLLQTIALKAWVERLKLKFYDCLVFSRIINSYPLVAVFEFFGGSNNLYPMFLFSWLTGVSLSAVIVNKKISGAAVGAFFALIFQTQHS